MRDFDYQVLRLTDRFYNDYPKEQYPEILEKKERPYNCLLIDSHLGYYICIPFRSEISHNNAFLFHKSARSGAARSGLDYTKSIIIDGEDPFDYLGARTALIDQDEFNEMRAHITTIAKDVQDYINNYVDYCTGQLKNPDEKLFNRSYRYSTLRYFHYELGIK